MNIYKLLLIIGFVPVTVRGMELTSSANNKLSSGYTTLIQRTVDGLCACHGSYSCQQEKDRRKSLRVQHHKESFQGNMDDPLQPKSLKEEFTEVGNSFKNGITSFANEVIYGVSRPFKEMKSDFAAFNRKHESTIENTKQGIQVVGKFVRNPRQTTMDVLGLEELPQEKMSNSTGMNAALDKSDNAVNKKVSLVISNKNNRFNFANATAQKAAQARASIARNIMHSLRTNNYSCGDAAKNGEASFAPDGKGLSITPRLDTIHDLSDVFSKPTLQGLKALTLGNNLTDAPFEILFNASPGLEKIDLSRNKIAIIADKDIQALANASNITDVDLSHNQLTKFKSKSLKWRKNQSERLDINLDGNTIWPVIQEKIRNGVTLSQGEKLYAYLRPFGYATGKAATSAILGYWIINKLIENNTQSLVEPMVSSYLPPIYKGMAQLAASGAISLGTSHLKSSPLGKQIAGKVSNLTGTLVQDMINKQEIMPLQKEMERKITKEIVTYVTDIANPLTVVKRWENPVHQAARSIRLKTVDVLKNPDNYIPTNTPERIKQALIDIPKNTLSDEAKKLLKHMPSTEMELRNMEVAGSLAANAATALVTGAIGWGIDGAVDLAGQGHIRKHYQPVVISMDNQQLIPSKKLEDI